MAAYAAEGSALPDLPEYRFAAIPGDAYGYYWAARELLAAVRQVGFVGAALAVLVVAGAVLAGYLLRRNWWAPLLPAAVVSGVLALLVATEIEGSGAPSLGWPLAWAAGLAVPKALGLSIDPDAAFPVGLAISLAANAAAVIALGVAGRRATGRAATGLLAAGLLAFWPLLETLVAGRSVRVNGTWLVETGLHMYSEPLSIALLLISLALLVDTRRTAGSTLVWAGIAMGAATTVRVASGLFAVATLLVLLGQDGPRAAARYAAGALAVAPIAIAYWPNGYTAALSSTEVFPEEPFALSYVARTWGDMAYLAPRALLVLVPLAVIGALALRGWPALPLLAIWAVLEPLLYSFYFVTWTTPRFVLASLSAALVLVAAGLVAVAHAVRIRTL